MAEEKKKNNNNNDNKEKKQNDITIVLKSHLHCDGCTHRFKKSILSFSGIERVKFEGEDKITAMGDGNVDPVKLRETVEKKMNKRVELVSPLPKNDPKHRTPEPNKPPQEPVVTTVVLKVAWHCDGCADKTRKAITSYKGVYYTSADKEKDQVSVRGEIDPAALVEHLRCKLRRPVEVVPEKKEKEKGKKDKEGKGGGVEAGKKEDGGGNSNHATTKGGANKAMEFYGQWNGYGSGQMGDLTDYFSEENALGCSVM